MHISSLAHTDRTVDITVSRGATNPPLAILQSFFALANRH